MSPRRARVGSLTGQPVRPGEMPTRLEVAVNVTGVDDAVVPAGVVVAAAVEAARSRAVLTFHVGLEAKAVERLLDAAVEPAEAHRIHTPAGHELANWARRLSSDAAEGRVVGPGPPVEVLAPSRLAAAWAERAALQGIAVEEWAEGAALSAPGGAVAWEAAAAERCQTMLEWAQEEALRALVARSPCAQPSSS